MTMISYHVSWPGADPYYNYNSSESNSMVSYYGVSGVPAGFIDGADAGWPPQPTWGNAVLARMAVPADGILEMTGAFDDLSMEGEVDIAFLPNGGIFGNHKVGLVLVEDGLYYMGSNGYPDHENVMRDVIPSPAGTPVTLSAGTWSNVTLDFAVPDVVEVTNARLVTFIQNVATKSILAAYSVPVLSILVDCENALGDLIDFGNINVQDLVLLVGIIIGSAADQEYCTYKAADINEDGQTNVQDIVLLVEMILGE